LDNNEDYRFNYFIDNILEKLKKDLKGCYLIICATYLDFVRLRNHFDKGINNNFF
jgi:hypothetical protein